MRGPTFHFLFVLLFLLFPACASTEGPGLLRTAEKGAVVVIGADWQACGEAEDCTEVPIGCEDCCRRDAVRADLEEAYDLEYERLCDIEVDADCPCEGTPAIPVCRANRCALAE